MKFIAFYRENFKGKTVPPKMHFLEAHTVNFIRRWRLPLGFLGEQGGESIHHELKGLARRFAGVRPSTSRLKQMLESHHLNSEPENKTIVPQVVPRKLKRKNEGE